MQNRHPFKYYQRHVEKQLATRLSAPTTPLQEAMAYSTLNPAKRLRPILVYLTGESLSLDRKLLDYPACAVEFIHAYSLIHDDLPAMDDDALRRGQPTCHIRFGEALAILAGDALQSLAFETLCANPHLPPDKLIAMGQVLARTIGAEGMAYGQTLDILGEKSAISQAALEKIHHLKTGKLLEACVLLPAIAANANPKLIENLTKFSTTLGLAFQIQDDILDVESTTQAMGKPQGSDNQQQKATYPAIMGIMQAKQQVVTLHKKALTYLEPYDKTFDALRDLTQWMLTLR